MTEQEIIYTMALTRVPRVNTAAQHRLMEEAGSASAVFDLSLIHISEPTRPY